MRKWISQNDIDLKRAPKYTKQWLSEYEVNSLCNHQTIIQSNF